MTSHNNTNKMFTISESDAHDLVDALKHAYNYLNKMRQWKQGKIDLAVPGCDAPRMMSDDELINETATVADLHQMLDDMLDK